MQSHTAKNTLCTAILLTAVFISQEIVAAPPPSIAECDATLQAALVDNLDFGDYEGAIGGTIVVSTAGARSTTGPTLAGGTVTAAAYDVWNNLAGCNVHKVTTTVPASATITGPASMTVNTFTKNPTNKFKLSATPGVPTRVTVGATLNSAAGQNAGAYIGPFDVQFNH